MSRWPAFLWAGLEVKRLNGRLTLEQETLAHQRGIAIVRSDEEALEVIEDVTEGRGRHRGAAVPMTDRICVRCQVELRVKENGMWLVAMAAFGPVAAYRADLWNCPVCDQETIIGSASSPGRRCGSGCEEQFLRNLQGRGERIVPYWLNERERRQCLELWPAWGEIAPRTTIDVEAKEADGNPL